MFRIITNKTLVRMLNAARNEGASSQAKSDTRLICTLLEVDRRLQKENNRLRGVKRDG